MNEMISVYIKDDQAVTIKRPINRMAEIFKDTIKTVYSAIDIAAKQGNSISLKQIIEQLREKYTDDEEFFVAVNMAVRFIKDWRASHANL